MSESPRPERGIYASARRLASSVVGLLHTRLELALVELQEEKVRLIDILLWIAAAMFMGVMALIITTFALVFLLPEAWKPVGLVCVSLFYISGCVFCIMVVRHKLLRNDPPFAQTIRELRKDREWLAHRN